MHRGMAQKGMTTNRRELLKFYKNVIVFIMTSFNSEYALDRLSIAFQ